MTKTTRKF